MSGQGLVQDELVQLVKGQNQEIDGQQAYQLKTVCDGWTLGVLVQKAGICAYLSDEPGISLVQHSLFLNLPDIDHSLDEIVLYVQRNNPLASSVSSTLYHSMSGTQVVSCASGDIDRQLNALETVHIYRKNGQWKIKSFFQGYAAGIQALLSSRNKQVLPTSRDTHVVVTLSWLPSSTEHFDTTAAYLGTGFPTISNLNLSCLYILKSGQRGGIFGGEERSSGSSHGVPYAKIESDRDAGRSNLDFNMAYAHKMYKYIVCVEITEGSRCWNDTQVEVETSICGTKTRQTVDSPLHTPIFVSSVIEVMNGEATRKEVNRFFLNYEEVSVNMGFTTA